jgi:hypothetical protein
LTIHHPQDSAGAMDEAHAEIPIPAFGDPEQGGFPSRGMLTGHESQPRSALAPMLETSGITPGGHQGRGCQRPNPSQLRQPLTRLMIFEDPLNLLSGSRDALIQGLEFHCQRL